MTEKYTTEEVQKSVDFFANGNTMNGSIINPLVYAAQKYLESLPVMEFYGDLNQYEGISLGVSPMNDDRGQRARDVLK